MDPVHDTFGVAKLSLPLTCCYKEILALVKKLALVPPRQTNHIILQLCFAAKELTRKSLAIASICIVEFLYNHHGCKDDSGSPSLGRHQRGIQAVKRQGRPGKADRGAHQLHVHNLLAL